MYVIDFGYQLYVSFWKRQFLKDMHGFIHGWNFKNKHIWMALSNLKYLII